MASKPLGRNRVTVKTKFVVPAFPSVAETRSSVNTLEPMLIDVPTKLIAAGGIGCSDVYSSTWLVATSAGSATNWAKPTSFAVSKMLNKSCGALGSGGGVIWPKRADLVDQSGRGRVARLNIGKQRSEGDRPADLHQVRIVEDVEVGRGDSVRVGLNVLHVGLQQELFIDVERGAARQRSAARVGQREVDEDGLSVVVENRAGRLVGEHDSPGRVRQVNEERFVRLDAGVAHHRYRHDLARFADRESERSAGGHVVGVGDRGRAVAGVVGHGHDVVLRDRQVDREQRVGGPGVTLHDRHGADGESLPHDRPDGLGVADHGAMTTRLTS